jgi:hypothetical protein
MCAFNRKPQQPQPARDAGSHMQRFDHDPASNELTAFVHRGGLATWLRVVETPWQVRVDPGTIPIRLLVVVLSPLMVLGAWIWRGEFARGLDDPLKIVGFVISCLAFPATFVLVVFLNRHLQSFGPFCVVDRVASRLDLPRLGISLSSPEIVRFVEFRGWFGVGPEGPHDLAVERVRELSVIVKTRESSFSRYQVVIGYGWPVSRIGQRLAEFFGVELTLVKG